MDSVKNVMVMRYGEIPPSLHLTMKWFGVGESFFSLNQINGKTEVHLRSSTQIPDKTKAETPSKILRPPAAPSEVPLIQRGDPPAPVS